MNVYDVCVIGAGVVGSAIARELARYDVSIAVLERAEDVCCGTSKANSGIVHAGYDAIPGTNMARFNVEGARMMPEICKTLDVPYVQNGSFVLCFDKSSLPGLEKLLEQGKENGVSPLSIISGDEAREIEPCISPEVVAALYAPEAGIVDPFLLTAAYAENACVNGADFFFNTEVSSVTQKEDGYELTSSGETFYARSVINAAGVYADTFYNQSLGTEAKHIIPRRGSYVLLDRAATPVPTHTLFQLPTKYGKGILVAPTCHQNTIVGPTAIDIDDKEGVNTTAEELRDVLQKARLSVPELPLNMAITSFAGLRAHEEGHEFTLEETTENYVHLVGIESPGLTSSPALGIHIAQKVAEKLGAQKKQTFVEKRVGVPRFYELAKEDQLALLAKNPAYGTIVCRCEHVTQGEIEEALNRPVPPNTLDGVKRRLRAGMGRCQGGFCSPLVMEILAGKAHELEKVHKAGPKSSIVYGFTKEPLHHE